MIVNKYQGNGGGGGGSYVLPAATANRLGGVKVGSGLTITNDGTLSASGGTYELPVASNQVLGGVKIGSGITIDANGVISAQGGSGEGNVKVYFYDELYSGDTYDHYDMSVPNEMEALANSGTPVYVLYRGQNKSVYLELTTKTGNTLVFNGADGDGYYSFSLVKNEPWTTSEITRNGSAPSDYNTLKEQVSANTENIETLSGVTSGLTEAVAGKQDELTAGNGIDLSGNTISIKAGEGLGFSGDTLVVSGGTGGGIEKVSSLPATAEEGDVVWLEGASRTGYTIVFGENVGDAEWPWGLDQEVFTIDGNSASARYSGRIGRWVKFSVYNSNYTEYSDIIVRPRIASNNAVLDIVVINGNHTIGLGQNGISMTSDVEFPDRGCLYVYTGGKWYSKPTFEWEYNQSEAVALLDKIRGGIEDFDVDNFVMRYAVNGASREFKITVIAQFGIDFQASDDLGTINDWGKLSVLNYRIDNNGGISDLVGEHWIVSSDQLPSYETRAIHIDSAGTVTDADGFGLLSEMYGISTRIEFIAEFDNKCNAAPLKWWYRQYEQVGGETKLIYYVCTEIPINGVVYKGIWKSAEYEWDSGLTPTTWTAV